MRSRIDAERKSAVVEVWPEHWHAVTVLRAMESQWNVVPGAGGLYYLGLNYASLPPVLKATRHLQHAQPIEQLLPRLQVLERAARDVRNRKLH